MFKACNYILLVFISALYLFAMQSCQVKTEKTYSHSNIFDSLKSNKDLENKFVNKEKLILDSLMEVGLLDLNDTAKWNLYNFCFSFLLPKAIDSNSIDKIYLSYLELRITDFIISTDKQSIKLFYNFLYKDSIRVQNYMAIVPYGVTLNIKTKQLDNFLVGWGTATSDNKQNRFIKEVIFPFALQNENKLNPWYKNELKNHGFVFN